MKQLPKKTALLLLTGFLLAQTTYYMENTTDTYIVCSDMDNSDAVSPCIVDGNIDTPIIY